MRFFISPLEDYREKPKTFLITYERDTPARLSASVEAAIETALLKEKELVDDPQLPISDRRRDNQLVRYGAGRGAGGPQVKPDRTQQHGQDDCKPKDPICILRTIRHGVLHDPALAGCSDYSRRALGQRRFSAKPASREIPLQGTASNAARVTGRR